MVFYLRLRPLTLLSPSGMSHGGYGGDLAGSLSDSMFLTAHYHWTVDTCASKPAIGIEKLIRFLLSSVADISRQSSEDLSRRFLHRPIFQITLYASLLYSVPRTL